MQQTDAAHRRLRELILDGVYAPGQRLTELETAAALAMSRTPVREAFRALVADGLVRSAGRGVSVVELGPEALRHAYQVRGALEALTAELAAGRQRRGEVAPAELTALERVAAQAEEATAAGRLEEAVRHNRRFHSGIAALSANPVAAGTLDRLWDQIQVSTRLSLAAPERPDQVADQHRRLLAAVVAGREAEAHAAAREHVADTCAASERAGAPADDRTDDPHERTR
ncbi:GntR family transcriptional regulator [Streptomyces sp. MI02-7b]|uniref:GntR family transcriptional regulator n=1 Tax=Streptomyces sp. MI02-7b TaxID=462941 RepID=UPI0029B6FB25|nr:GntR family transcriptional regulator [Streptomyces sp. MI02-7b]MDX3072231.1 GntR family transcriptional regulator [Streptomyces sp. MI02-7b]